MIVTAIVPISKSRFRVIFDCNIALVLYKGDLSHYSIHEGTEITDDQLLDLKTKRLLPRAKERSLYLFDKKDYTYREMYRKLVTCGYSEDVIEQVTNWLVQKDYLNDERYTEQYIRAKMQFDSRNKMMGALLRKELDRDLIKDVMDRVLEDSSSLLEGEQIEAYLRKKHYYETEQTEADRRKLIAALMRRGYRYDAIKSKMRLEEDACYDSEE